MPMLVNYPFLFYVSGFLLLAIFNMILCLTNPIMRQYAFQAFVGTLVFGFFPM